jgi:hypothetical protein
MTTPRRALVVAVLLAAAGGALVEDRWGQAGPEERWAADPAGAEFEALVSGSAAARELGCREVRRHRADLIRRLVAFIDDEKARQERPAVVAEIIRLLGTLRASEAVDVLADQISFGERQYQRLPALEDYPAAMALTDIGHPAIPALLSTIASEDRGSGRSWLASDCLRRMDGWQITVVRLRLAAEKEPDADCRQRLLAEAQRIEEIWGRSPPAP